MYLSVYLSGYTFRHELTSQADISDFGRGHIFRRNRHKNNKKSSCYLPENDKKPGRCYGIWRFPSNVYRSDHETRKGPRVLGAHVVNAIFACMLCVRAQVVAPVPDPDDKKGQKGV